ncbi:MAG: toxin-antitoxin system YwqK family antitoxin [Cetobacterium sp.]
MKKNNMFFKNCKQDGTEGFFSIYFFDNDEEIEYLNISYNSFVIKNEENCRYIKYHLSENYALEYWEFLLENTGIIRSIFDESSYEDITFSISDSSIIKIEVFENETNNLMSQRIVTPNGYDTLIINPALKEYCSENFEFVKNGPRYLYNEKNILLEEEKYLNGKLVGTSKHYHEDGSLKSLINSNEIVEFYEEGQMKSKQYNFRKFSKLIEYYPNGSLMSVGTLNPNNEYIGIGWTFYDNSQLKKICSYVNNLIDGEYKDFYENGTLKTHSFYILGKENCEFKSFYSNGQIECIIDLQNGIRSGKFLKYYKSGQLEDETYYSNNAPISNSILYYESGNIYAKLAYQNGLRVGISQWFYETGELKSISKYDLIDGNSYLSYSKSYYSSGALERYIQWEDALCEHNHDDYSYNIIRGSEILEFSYYENGKLRKKQKLIKENIYSIERYNNDSLIQKGTFFRNESVFYWIGKLITFNLDKSTKTVINYSNNGKFISRLNYVNDILDNTTNYLSAKNLYKFTSYYPDGSLREEGYYNYKDNYSEDIYWVGEHKFYSEKGECNE